MTPYSALVEGTGQICPRIRGSSNPMECSCSGMRLTESVWPEIP